MCHDQSQSARTPNGIRINRTEYVIDNKYARGSRVLRKMKNIYVYIQYISRAKR